MSDTHGTYRRVSVLDAARIMGVSPTTVRRMIKAGSLQVERAIRPQGHTFLVLLPPDIQPDATARQQVSAEARTEVPPSDAMAALIQATLAPIVAPLVAEQAALRQTVERQAERLESQAETIGRQGAELEAERAARQQLLTERDAVERSRQRDVRRLSIALAVAGALAVAAGTAPAWVR